MSRRFFLNRPKSFNPILDQNGNTTKQKRNSFNFRNLRSLTYSSLPTSLLYYFDAHVTIFNKKHALYTHTQSYFGWKLIFSKNVDDAPKSVDYPKYTAITYNTFKISLMVFTYKNAIFLISILNFVNFVPFPVNI